MTQGDKLILIVDDDTDFLSALQVTLEASGFKVIGASNEAQGMRFFIEHNPDLILCDIMMEKIDSGIRLVREIRKKNTYVPIYLLSDIGSLTAANIDIHALGCNGSLQKPYNPDELLRVVTREIQKN